ncbi:MAG TPA: hypothetical protein VHU83_01515 [Bryobacteraceae bacterium]|jgi:hypothetical protein|nr:hypothetical protein [Bryobacteraceae bacterium]
MVSRDTSHVPYIEEQTAAPRASRRALLLAPALLLLPAVAYSQAPLPPPRPDFSGRWRMVKDKSDFGGFTIPDLVVRVIEHRDPTLNVHTIQTTGTKTTTADVSYFTDGSQTSNVINGHDATSKAFWDGPALVIRTNMKDSKGEDVVIEDRWELSQDQQTLTTTSHIETPAGQVDMKLVCVKEKAAG